MVPKRYEDNFQPVSVEKWGIYHRKKDGWKFSVFRKNGFYGIKLISAESPTLGESKYIHFILLSWPDQTGEPNKSHWLTIIPSLWNTVNFCVTLQPFFSYYLLSFLPLFVYLYLFILVAIDYYYLFSYAMISTSILTMEHYSCS